MSKTFSNPRAREFQKMLEAKLSVVLGGSGKVQFGTMRVFSKLDAANKGVDFKLSDKVSVIPEVEMLLPEDRIAIVYSAAIGIYAVDVTGAGAARVEQTANGRYISYPHSTVFTPAEIKSLRALYNGRLKFETDQDIRFDTVAMSDFQEVPQQSSEIVYGLQHKFLPTYFPMVGGKPNVLTLKMASNSDITNIAGTATSQNYACLEFGVMYLVGATGLKKDDIMGALGF
jgi:hypothetical protein